MRNEVALLEVFCMKPMVLVELLKLSSSSLRVVFPEMSRKCEIGKAVFVISVIKVLDGSGR